MKNGLVRSGGPRSEKSPELYEYGNILGYMVYRVPSNILTYVVFDHNKNRYHYYDQTDREHIFDDDYIKEGLAKFIKIDICSSE